MSDCTSGVDVLDAQLHRCLADLRESVAGASFLRLEPVWHRFGAFAARSGARSLAEVSPPMAAAFVRSRTNAGDRPSTATMHNRRTSLRLLYGTARRLELAHGDPTLDLTLPPRVVGDFRPLTDDEVELCRDAALWWMTSQRFAAVWALAESTARGAELGAVRAADVDLDGGRVRLSGGTRVEPRWAPLTEWGHATLARRLASIDADVFVAYRGRSPGAASRVSAASAVTAVLTRAGLGDEADVRPSSVAAWAGRLAFDRNGNIADAAQALGMRSLDTTARMIGWNWAA